MAILNKNGVTKINNYSSAMELSDGSLWMPIMVQDNKNGSNMFTASDNTGNYIYHNDTCWSCFNLINTAARPTSNIYEFLVVQEYEKDKSFNYYRWTQTINPFNATWANVNPSSGNVTHLGDSATYGGMYKKDDTNVFMCFANDTENNWYGCAHRKLWGGTAGTDGYVPGYNHVKVYGLQIVYIRVSRIDTQIHTSQIVAKDFIEY